MFGQGVHIWLQPIGEALQLSVFVMIIMILMEYVSLRNDKVRAKGIEKETKKWKQILFAVMLGCIPGCVGGFAAVSFYTHGIWSFGAVLAASFSALGDDAFRMSAMMPRTYFIITLLLVVIGFAVGLIVDKIPFFASFRTHSSEHIHIHSEDEDKKPPIRFIKLRGKEWSLGRVLLITALLLYIYSLLFGGSTHGDIMLGNGIEEGCASKADCSHEHGFGEWIFENGLFLALSIAALWVVVVAKDHFIQVHLWEHVLKEHFLSIFAWTAGTLYVLFLWRAFAGPISFNLEAVDIKILLLAISVAIGWIPYSGPHFLFIQLFASSVIPFSVLFANSIVQDGHTSLILISESRKQFCYLKGVKSLIAIIIGVFGIWIGF